MRGPLADNRVEHHQKRAHDGEDNLGQEADQVAGTRHVINGHWRPRYELASGPGTERLPGSARARGRSLSPPAAETFASTSPSTPSSRPAESQPPTRAG